MGNSKVIFGNETLIDLTGDTVTPDTLLAGTTAHNRSGNQIVGTATVPDTLDDLTDVELTSPAEGDLLQRNGNGEWVNSAAVPNALAAVMDNGVVNRVFTPYHEASQVKDGVTFTENSDGTISLSGSSTNPSGTILTLRDRGTAPYWNLPAGEYYVSGGIPGAVDVIFFRTYNGARQDLATSTGGSVLSPAINSTDNLGLRIFIPYNVSVTGKTVKPMVYDKRFGPNQSYRPWAMTNRELTEVKTIYDQNSITITRQANVVCMQFHECTPAAIAALNLSALGILPMAQLSTFQCRCDRKPTTVEWNTDGSILNVGNYASYGASFTDLKSNTSLTVWGTITYICK